ncbi:hypothetical protein ABEG18_18255 [Alsobacter sp. KACC 23698]|uniref:Uncharacterized protein n=1 Tax=Alsobacter sp. KACC 23698 TaxID=3149229 RepID=A0AAU7JBA4_9HYPH
MLVYGDAVRVADPVAEWSEVRLAWRRACGEAEPLSRHAGLAQTFIAAGELAQGLADAEAEAAGADEPGPASLLVMDALRDMARALLASWESGFDTRPPPQDWSDLPAGAPAGPLRCKRPEGYAFYALYPEGYGVAARALAGREPLHVIGLRSIGTGLAAMAAAGAAAAGAEAAGEGAATVHTVRPGGDPFRRGVSPGPRLRAAPADACFAIADEGPGLSGSSFGCVADWLRDRGAAPERIALLPSHAGEPGPQADPRRRAQWRRLRRLHIPFDTLVLRADAPRRGLQGWVESVVGPLDGPLREISGGGWRTVQRGSSEEGWPAVNAGQERLKFLASAGGRRWLVKFSGLDRIGAAALGRAERLAEAGFTPAPAGWRHGFLVERWRDDARPAPDEALRGARFRDRLADYLGFRARAFPADPSGGAVPLGASLADLAHMLAVNAAEAFGPEAHGATAPYRDRAVMLQRRVVPVITDNRLMAPEWLVAPDGTILKTDALDHAFSHDLVGPQDVAWDVAGAAVEFGLDAPALARLIERTGSAAGRPVDPEFVAFLAPCYAAFHLGAAEMAVAAHAGWPEEEARLRALAQRRRDSLAALLKRDAPAAAPAPSS